ncbi:hypothetical protein REC12_01140 [Desulfosporosinus sp. PR]|uniref:MutS-related protein n=1 Tax=Candidatus Desulfosporosinus nitrosoreducens TaxID=3401928 RepID=UPI0027F8BE86|nr:hypothetical protein [Desulfosporosinus sp. PR]MDQ7092194.1 hypothetical protein [Desulfosporosinus sp. PR]
MFESILFPPQATRPEPMVQPPAYFRDLGLDQIVETVTRSCDDPQLFFTPIRDRATILYRQAIMGDLEDMTLRRRFAKLSSQLRTLRRQLIARGQVKLEYVECSSLLSAAEQYLTILREFTAGFPYGKIHSQGLTDFLRYIRHCLNSPQIVRMHMDLTDLSRKLQAVEYTILLHNNKIQVAKPEEGQSLDKLVAELFDRFQQENHGGGTCQAPAGEADPRNENAILTLLADHYPELFAQLRIFRADYEDFADSRVIQLASDIQFYLSYLDYTDHMKDLACSFCYPEITETWEGCQADNSFDLALAARISEQRESIVTNGFELRGTERILVISGPNQGGKTTYARMLGQLHYLASLGVRVPGSSAALRLPDRIFTHFVETGRQGADNLREELLRLKEITEHATEQSLILINEIFASVSHEDGLFLGNRMMERFTEIGCMAVCVTFFEELAVYSPQTVSMMSGILPGPGAQRSHRITRQAPDGQAYALSLAEKKELTYEQIIRRLTQ